MSYNQMAESFSRAAAVPHVDPRFDWPAGWSKFDQVYSEIADATPTDEPFRLSTLIDELPLLAALAPKTQHEILAVVRRDMCSLKKGDGLVRVRGGVYQWVFRGAS